jgi:psp operon transcriptional activator
MGDVISHDHVALGESEEFLNLQEQIRRAAAVDRSVILIGERGTGKELAAARLHLLSARWNKPYITLNCASLAPSLIESELFGHEAGAFTGAARRREGRFELADTGSLFLDEVADIPLPAQEKILRVVEYGRFERVGSSSTIETDVRLIAATNKDPRVLAEEGRFRRDLLDRLSFDVITLPPLRARRGDVMLLARHFARRMAAELGLEDQPRFALSAERTLLAYDWPGNVRELKNAVERSMCRAAGEIIQEIHLDPFDSPYVPQRPSPTPRRLVAAASVQTQAGQEAASTRWAHLDLHDRRDPEDRAELAGLESLTLGEAIDEFRLRLMKRALDKARHNQRLAAQRLGITYDQFRGYYRKHEARFREARES